MTRKSVDVIIPTFHPDGTLRELLSMLSKQTVPPDHILIVNTDESGLDEKLIKGTERAEVFHIAADEFDHAATRNLGAEFSGADYIICMTQDAVPADERLIEELLGSFSDPLVKAAYARQLPKSDSRIAEGFTRLYNYPPEGFVKSIEDLPELGVKTFFCSNVCAAYDHKLFREMKGFSAPAVFNEDMVYAARLIRLGYSIAYAADAQVYHSHNYGNIQQFKRNFDNGASWAMRPEIFSGIPSSGEGMGMVKYVLGQMAEAGRWGLMLPFIVQCGFRFLGFRAGRMYKHLPRRLVYAFTSNRSFWEHYYKGLDD